MEVDIGEDWGRRKTEKGKTSYQVWGEWREGKPEETTGIGLG